MLYRSMEEVGASSSSSSPPGNSESHRRMGSETEESSRFVPFHLVQQPSTQRPSFLAQIRALLFWPSDDEARNKPDAVLSAPLNAPPSQDDDDDAAQIIIRNKCNALLQCVRKVRRDFVPESSWLILTLLGASMSIVAWIIDEIIDLLLDVRNDIGRLPKRLGERNEWLYSLDNSSSFALWWIWAMFWGTFAVAVCKLLSPQAEGLGIENIRSIMAGFPLAGYLDVYTMVAKILGFIGVQAAGLNLGNEGPFVHIACSLAMLYLDLGMFSEIKRNRSLQRQVLSAACATGISSIFGAPVGGVLFAIEVTSHLLHTADYWKAFYAAVLSKLVYSLLSRVGNARESHISLFPTAFTAQPFSLWEIPLFLLLSLACGLLGGFFVKYALRTSAISRAHFNAWLWAWIVITVHAVLTWFTGQFMKRSLANAIADLLVSGEMSPSAQVSADQRLHSSDWGSPSLFFNLVLFAALNSLLFALALSLQVPSGTLYPMLVVGLSLGRFFGEFVKLVGLSSAVPAGYALVGASAFVAGCTGATSTAVIMFEITGQLSFMVPILLAVVVGRASGKVISPDLYEALQIAKNLPNIPPLSRQRSYALPAKYLMNENNVPVLPRRCALHRVRSAVARSSTTGLAEEDLFAMVNNDRDGFYLTSCTRAQLRQVLARFPPPGGEGEGEEEMVDLLACMTIERIAPTCTTRTPAIDLLYLFEQSLSPTVFVTRQRRVVGFVHLAAIRHLIELHSL